MRIDLDFSLLTDLPEIEFGVRANLTDLQGQSFDKELEVNIQLKRLQEPKDKQEAIEIPLIGVAPLDADLVEECIAVAGEASSKFGSIQRNIVASVAC